MKLVTHTSTALISSAIVLNYSNCTEFTAIILYGIAVYFTQFALDTFGHTWVTYRGKRFPKRNALHSLPGIMGMGLVAGLPFTFSCPLLGLGIIVGLLVHWLEDLVTEGGVYLAGKRIRLPVRIEYDNVFINKLTILLFITLYFLTPTTTAVLSMEAPMILVVYNIMVIAYAVLAFLYV